jgi:altronate hydrolase
MAKTRADGKFVQEQFAPFLMSHFPCDSVSNPAPDFLGYLRPDGRAGTRNYIGVLVVGNCASTAARSVASWFTPDRLAGFANVDGVLPFVHELGCGMEKSGEPMDLLRRTLGGTIRNPNLAGAVVMALGCERNNIYAFLEQEGLETGDLLKTVVLQEVGGTTRGIEDGIVAVNAMLPLVNQSVRAPTPAYTKFVASEITRWTQVIKAAGIKPE